MLSSCVTKVPFKVSSVVPAAEGKVKIKKDDNQNYNIDISILHLAEPDKLDPPRRVYVVWIDTDKNDIKNIGQLIPSSGFLSKTLKSTLQTVTPFNPEGLFITAEKNANIQQPGNFVIMSTKSFKVK